MLSRTKLILQIVAFIFIFQQSAFAHFINDEMNQRKELKIIEKTEVKVEAKKTAKIETPSKPKAKAKTKAKPKTRTRDLGYVNFIKGESLYDIMDQAERTNKAIFIDFYANWCSPCKMMEMEVFNDNSVANYMNSNFINYKVDINTRRGNNIAYKYGVKLLPTVIIITPKGEVIARETGFLDTKEFIEFARNAIR